MRNITAGVSLRGKHTYTCDVTLHITNLNVRFRSVRLAIAPIAIARNPNETGVLLAIVREGAVLTGTVRLVPVSDKEEIEPRCKICEFGLNVHTVMVSVGNGVRTNVRCKFRNNFIV